MKNKKYTLYKSVVYISPLRHYLKFRGPEMLGSLWNIFEIKLILFDIGINIYLHQQTEELR